MAALVPFLLAGASGCAGTERPIFESTALTPSSPGPTVEPRPPDKRDAGTVLPIRPPVLPPPVPQTSDDDGGVELTVDPGLDPSATFLWSETLPGAGTCKAGRYVGGFECTMPGLGGWPVSISGEVAFTLEGSAEEQTLIVTEGSIDGSFFIAPTMSGQLDCTRDRFDAITIDGQAILIATGAFAAALSGKFDADSLGIEGPFAMINDLGQQCDGTFRVGIAP